MKDFEPKIVPITLLTPSHYCCDLVDFEDNSQLVFNTVVNCTLFLNNPGCNI